jgi:hypothetical protein
LFDIEKEIAMEKTLLFPLLFPLWVVIGVMAVIVFAVLWSAHVQGIRVWRAYGRKAYGRRAFAGKAFLLMVGLVSVAAMFLMVVVPFLAVSVIIGAVPSFIILAASIGTAVLVTSLLEVKKVKIGRLLAKAGLLLLDRIDLRVSEAVTLIDLAYAKRDVPSNVTTAAVKSASDTAADLMIAFEDLLRGLYQGWTIKWRNFRISIKYLLIRAITPVVEVFERSRK